MGMFDDIRCEMPLPDGWVHGSFQTKDLDCELALYRITTDGRLERQVCEYEPDGPPGPHPFFDGWNDFQKMKRVSEAWVQQDHHGDLYFYSYEGDYNKGPPPVWHEYRARFTEGRVTSLICVPSPHLPAESNASGPNEVSASDLPPDEPAILNSSIPKSAGKESAP